MTALDLLAIAPLLVLGAVITTLLLLIAWRRRHGLAASVAGLGLLATVASAIPALTVAPRRVTPLLVADRLFLFYAAVLGLAAFTVVLLAAGYWQRREDQQREEFYLLVLLATLGAIVLGGAVHFASLFLGLELLSVALYGLLAYPRRHRLSLEAGVKYLILAAASSAFLLFGLALVYAETGSMTLATLAAAGGGSPLALTGFLLAFVGIGFKLALVPFHLWTADVYTGAPAPSVAFVASVSKGGVFALVLRLVVAGEAVPVAGGPETLFVALAAIGVLSMTVGNLLALLQENVKRLLAYSSVAHLGYLVVTLLAGSDLGVEAGTYYVVAYLATILGAFGVVGAVSPPGGEAESIDDYRGLFWRRPAVAGVFTVMILSLAGIPLTAGFVAKFYVLAVGVDAALWWLVLILVANSAVGLFYYLRVVVAMLSPVQEEKSVHSIGLPAAIGLGLVTAAVLVLGTYPAPLVTVLRTFL